MNLTMDLKSSLTPSELYDAYIEVGSEPPEWLAVMLHKKSRRITDQDELTRVAIESGVPSLFAVAEPDESRLDALRDGGGLYVFGRQGTGKTWLASRIAKGWLMNGMGRVRFVSSVRLLSEISDTYGGNGSEGQVLDRYTSCPLLIVDDLGKEVPSQWALSKLFLIFDTRYSEQRPTIITTQYGTPILAAHMAQGGDRETAMAIVSRFREKYKSVNLGDVDRRARG